MLDLKKYLNVYKFNTVLPGTGQKVNFKPVTTWQMKELISFDGDTDTALDKLINECVTDEGFDVANISLRDRFFLLVELRKKSKGSEYEIAYECEKCKSQVIDKLNLDNLVVKKAGKLNKVIKLDNNISVEVDFITRNTQIKAIELAATIESGEVGVNKKNIDEAVLNYMLSIKKIITPDGTIDNPSTDDLLVLLKEAPRSFYDDIVKWHDALEFGVEFKLSSKCSLCNNIINIDIPLESFFI